MEVTKKDWLCNQCSLQFDTKNIFSLHLKLLHKHKNAKRSNKNELKSIPSDGLSDSNKSILSDERSDSHIASNQKERKSFKCEICHYHSSSNIPLSLF